MILDLHFELVATLVGGNSITLYYNSVLGPSCITSNPPLNRMLL